MATQRFGAGIWHFATYLDRYATDGYGAPRSVIEAIDLAGQVRDLSVVDINYPFFGGDFSNAQVADVFGAMERDIGGRLQGLLADGGATSNDFLMQLQSDVLDRPVTRSGQAEVGAIGVAAMALRRLTGESPHLDASTVEFSPRAEMASWRSAVTNDWKSLLSRLTAS